MDLDKEAYFALTKLRERNLLFHWTVITSLEDIIKSGFIHPNLGQFGYSYPQSIGSLGATLNSVSLFDFDSRNEDLVLSQSSEWLYFRATEPIQKVLIGISKEDIINSGVKLKNSWDILCDPKKPETYRRIPDVEVYYAGSISCSFFKKIFVFHNTKMKSKYNEFDYSPSIIKTLSALN